MGIYDSRDLLIRTVDPLQNPTLYTNDVARRQVSQTDPVLRTTTFGYDADGRKLAATNAAQEVTSQTWDARGNMLQLTDGAGHLSTPLTMPQATKSYSRIATGKNGSSNLTEPTG